MIGTVDVIVQAAKPDFPLTPFKAFVSSPSSVRVRNVPRRIGTWDITSVSVSVDYPDGTTETAACVLTAGVWVGTVPGCETPGDALRGFVVRADGIDESGDAVTGYVLGVGDVEILNRETALTPGVVTFKGDPGSGGTMDYSQLENKPSINGHTLAGSSTLDQIGAQKKLTAGSNITITADGVISSTGGGGGGSVVESETNPGYAANADHAGSADSANSANSSAYATEAQSAYQAVQAVSAETVPWSGVTDTPTTVEGYGIEDAATKDQLRVTMQLVGNDPYTIQLDGVVQTFDQVKALAETRNAVIQRGQGTYRVTYIGANEMMWDVTGTVAGNVQTGQIHIFLQDGQTVVQRVEPKVLATKPIVDSVSAMAAYPMVAFSGGTLKDRAINYTEGDWTVAFPPPGDNARDFVLVVGVGTGDAPTITFPTTGVSYFSDDENVWTAEAGKMNCWYFSELNHGMFMVSHKALDAVAQ